MKTNTLHDQLQLLSDNLCLYYARLVDDIHQRLMDQAIATGYQGLKLSHALILPQIAADGSRIIDIARSQGVSKQAIGQIANELEKLGFIKKIADAGDKRSKKLMLTSKGIDLIRQSASSMRDADRELASLIGDTQFTQLQQLSEQLFRAMRLKFPDAGQYTPQIGRQLPLIVYATSISNQLNLLLKQINSEKGHPPLKRSYWHVLEKIMEKGIRINDLAEMNGISKQAISQLANEIEKAGYLSRVDDPLDKRSKQLVPTSKGYELIRHTLDSTRAVENIVRDKIGDAQYQTLQLCLQNYNRLSRSQPHHPSIGQDLQQRLLTNLEQQIRQAATPGQHPWLVRQGDGYRLSEQALQQLTALRFSAD